MYEMACKTSFELHHHFPKLAEESGFTFNTHRPRVLIDWNKIKLIDIESLIRERKFVLIEQHLNDILDCVLESEFDVRILDEGVMKMFRLAQLSVEYQQFCRHYLDRSVYVLREEITAMTQDLEATKKELNEKDEEIKKLRKRTRNTFKSPLPYGNDNIAAMILKTLTNKSDIFPSTSNADNLQYNKCTFCDKVFLNQLYLKSHISRRHPNENEISHKRENDQHNETTKLSNEIMELQNKLRDMELIITTNANSQINKTIVKPMETQTDKETIQSTKENIKDDEDTTKNEEYLVNKIEQWKKEEHEKYSKEINILRNEIIETMNTIKEKELQQPLQKDTYVPEQLNSTIIQQTAEIFTLKQELNNYKQERENETTERCKETDAKISFWAKRAETQSKQYEALLQKLNDVAKDAKESRTLAEAERERAEHLQALLQQNLNNKTVESVNSTPAPIPFTASSKKTTKRNNNRKSVNKSYHTCDQVADRNTIENLHRKAQELLNISSISSSSSDSSDVPTEKSKPINTTAKEYQDIIVKRCKVPDQQGEIKSNGKSQVRDIEEKKYLSQSSNKDDIHEVIKTKMLKLKKETSKSHSKVVKENTKVKVPGSPIKVIRAKITEEVNNRLVSFGVDPLKSRLPKKEFQKQRIGLQQLLEIKSKKNPTHEKVRYAIIAFLNSNTTEETTERSPPHEYISPKKLTKPLRSFTSVLSNVKTKALSLVKHNDAGIKVSRTSLHSNDSKKAMSLLMTPPGSAPTSPASQQRSPIKKNSDSVRAQASTNAKIKYNYESTITADKTKDSSPIVNEPKTTATVAYDTDSESNASDHKYYNNAIFPPSSKSIENLIKSPARRPSSADIPQNHAVRKYAIDNTDLYIRTQSVSNLSEVKPEFTSNGQKPTKINTTSSDEEESLADLSYKKMAPDENVQNIKQTKGVLKNASSVSSLNKKKVLFDMDAIQMKSVSASPSQSITEKSDGNEKYELGLVNLDTDEWDISSIENEPLKEDVKKQISTRTSPKIAELKQTIESKLARRNEAPPTGIVGAVDVLAGPRLKPPSIGGSNTSLGSSILDDSDIIPNTHKAFVRPKKISKKDDSELDISEFSVDGMTNKNESF